MKVYCRCFEKGLTSTPPIPLNWITRDESEGDLCRIDDCGFEEHDIIFDQWRYTCCKHQNGELSDERLGNVSTVGGFRNALRCSNENKYLSLKSLFLSGPNNPYSVQLLKSIKSELVEFRECTHFTKKCEYTANALEKICGVAIENDLPAHLC